MLFGKSLKGQNIGHLFHSFPSLTVEKLQVGFFFLITNFATMGGGGGGELTQLK